jgi:CTP synthase
MGARYIFVIGGVLSGLGKGIVTSSIGKLLQSYGYKVTAVKIDPYINIDAGTMRPTEHGEVWVTEDGGEIDQDLGNYERFLNKNLPKRNNITTGQIYLSVINRERALGYNGKNAEVIPDIINEIKDRIHAVEEDNDFVLVEIGGTTGDIQNEVFLYAARELGREQPAIYILVTYVPFLKNVGELKTKPTQQAAALLRATGIMPDFIVTRNDRRLDEPRREKISRQCFIDKEAVIEDPDSETIYEVPLIFKEQEFGKKILAKFGLKPKQEDLSNWQKLVENLKNADRIVKIGVVGKYVSYGDSEHKDVYLSVLEAIKHASAHLKVKPIIEQIQSTRIEKEGTNILRKYDGIVVPGGFGKTGTEGIIETIKFCRENNIPFLGLCYGMQMAVIEFARNVCGLNSANTTENEPNTPYPVIDFMPEQKELIRLKQYGATMRLGAYPAILKEGTKVRELYGKEFVSERHRHRYEVNPEYIETLEKHGLIFSGTSPDKTLMEFLELPTHKFFIATQAHPEFHSRFENPSPLFVGFIKACLEMPQQKVLNNE